ncbi:hypothetical protein [Asticcacaulis sp.]|uniref:hypothetical protein n=1 Tax=Asticcacaulis sp. TaxID=1872648 RepID=UPI00263598B4|nr:hypothetical protein [Asticcacaulis sp.]
MKPLADSVVISRRFQRSIRVDADITLSAMEGFVCPPSASAALVNMAAQVQAGQGAFTWTGPYGCGKSSLAVVLGAFVGGPGTLRDAARSALGVEVAAEVATRLGIGKDGWRVLPVVGRREDPETVLAEALEGAKWTRRRRTGKADNVITQLLSAADYAPGSGLLVIIDEMGKFLEHAAAGGDVYFFQRLAEAASGSGGRLLVVGVLHQAFDDYASRLSGGSREEWLKIQGRFADIPINVAGEEQVELIARAIQGGARPVGNVIHAEAIAAAVRGNRPGTAAAFGERLNQCWPLHPVVACLLGPLSRRSFGQNQRSVFGFLNSGEPFGFQEYLKTTSADGAEPYGVIQFWDYLRANLEPSILASLDGHRWSLAVEAVERCEAKGGDTDHLAVVKAVAMIDLFKERSGLSPSLEVIGHTLPHIMTARLEAVLDDLRTWSVLIYRRHADAFAIFAGSDFDIDAAVAKARSHMNGVDLGRLRSLAMLQPILAKAHHHKTGALRWFDVDLAAVSDAVEAVRTYKPKGGASGLFLLLIGMKAEAEQTVKKAWRKAAEATGAWPVAVGWTRYSSSIREAVGELMALEAVRSNSAELSGDAVARREVNARITRAAAEVEDLLRRAFADAEWGWHQERADVRLETRAGCGARSLSVIASELANGRYHQCPSLHNELLNRIRPSSNAVAAQKDLLRAMIQNWSRERLGFDQWPAPAGMYASLLLRTGLHVPDPSRESQWRFVAPGEVSRDEANLLPLWKRADELFKKAGPAGLDLEQLFNVWRAPPFGIRDGLLPVIGIAYYLSRAERLAVYLDGIFQPRLSNLLVDRLAQESSSVRLRWTETTAFHARFLSGVADLVVELGGLDTGQTQPSTFDVAKGLVSVVMNLQPWVLRTTRLSPVALKVRNLAKLASDPNKLLLDDIPALFQDREAAASDADGLVTAIRAGLAELVGAYSKMLSDLETTMLRELRIRERSPESLAELRARAEAVRNLNGNLRFDAFATRLAGYSGEPVDIEGIASLAASKSSRDWVDRDIDNAMVEIALLAQQFIKAEGLAHVKGRSDGRLSMAIFISDPDRPSPIAPDFDISVREKPELGRLVEQLRGIIGEARVSRDMALAAVALLGAKLAEEGLEDGESTVFPGPRPEHVSPRSRRTH